MLCAYTSPNCALIRSQNSVCRTWPRVLAPRDGTCSADGSGLAGGPGLAGGLGWPAEPGREGPRRSFARCVVIKYVGSSGNRGTPRDLGRAPSDQRAGVAGPTEAGTVHDGGADGCACGGERGNPSRTG